MNRAIRVLAYILRHLVQKLEPTLAAGSNHRIQSLGGDTPNISPFHDISIVASSHDTVPLNFKRFE